ncbi:MAG: FtsX-like permease family protein [Acidimicrobiales bacterium]
MIRLGLRLTLGGGRDAAARLVVIAAAVALGVGMLLVTLAGVNAVNSQNARYAWLETGARLHAARSATGAPAAPPAKGAARPAADPLWWLLSADEFHGHVIGRVDVAATGAGSPVPPGIPHLPGPGQFYASPALSKLLASTPAAQLAARYPGKQIGTIGDAALPAPDSLVVIVGHTPAQLSRVRGAVEVATISTTSPSSCNGASCIAIGINASSIDLILAVVAAALLFPVLIFIGTATRLSAARREQRFAAMRLVGATPRQVAVISAVESTIAAVIGVAGGFGLFYALRPALAPIPFTGAPFFVSDLSLNLLDVLLVAAGVPVAAAVVARLALRRVIVSPLGVSRRVTPRAPRVWRLLPALAGLAELGWFVHAGRPESTQGQIEAYLPGVLLVMFGLVLAGPWLTSLGSRLMVRRASRPSGIIAARRLSDNPQAGFRAVSGLVLALFVTSVAVGVITTMDFYRGGSTAASAADRATLVAQYADFRTDPPSTPVTTVPPTLVSELRSVPGVRAVTVVHAPPGLASARAEAQPGTIRLTGPPPGLVSCAQLETTPALGRCPAGAETATIVPLDIGTQFAPAVLPASTVPAARLGSLPVETVAVATDGSGAAIERARTLLEDAYPYFSAPTTIAEVNSQRPSTARMAGYQRLADVVVLTSLPIAGCTLAVSVAAGLNDRKRPFSLLRLTGAPLGLLRRVVILESAVPLLLAAVASIGIAFLVAYLFLDSQLNETLRPPGTVFYGVVVAGLVASLLVIASTLPVLRWVTGPETARNE